MFIEVYFDRVKRKGVSETDRRIVERKGYKTKCSTKGERNWRQQRPKIKKPSKTQKSIPKIHQHFKLWPV